MDTQTVVALSIVLLSAIVVVSRMKESLSGWFKNDSTNSPCGSCAGCDGKRTDSLVQIQPLARSSRKQV